MGKVLQFNARPPREPQAEPAEQDALILTSCSHCSKRALCLREHDAFGRFICQRCDADRANNRWRHPPSA